MFLINVKLKQPLRISPAQYVGLDYAVLIAPIEYQLLMTQNQNDCFQATLPTVSQVITDRESLRARQIKDVGRSVSRMDVIQDLSTAH